MLLRRSLRTLWPLLLLLPACASPTGTRECASDSECNLASGGACLAAPSGRSWCSYASDCASGSRWSEFAGDSLAGQCVATDSDAGAADGGVDAGDGPFLLTVDRAGGGSGTVTSTPPGIACGDFCSSSYTAGIEVTLTQSPAPGSVFAGWAGDCMGTAACVVTMDQTRDVTATFVINELTVNRTGTGVGDVTSVPSGINCGGVCAAPFTVGTSVMLTATEGPASSFMGWADSCAGAGACSVTMDGPRTVEATFNVAGEYLWAHQYGSGAMQEIGTALAIDGAGNTLLAGRFTNTINVGGGDLMAMGAGEESFVAKYSPEGAHLWDRHLAGTATVNAMAADGAGGVIAVGSFSGTVDFGMGPVVSGGETAFVLKLSQVDGGTEWVHTFGPSYARATSVAAAGSKVAVGGTFQGDMLDAGGVYLSSAAGSTDGFVVTYESSGPATQAIVFGTTYEPVAVAIEPSGAIAIAGSFAGTLQLNPGTLTSASGTSDLFVLRYLGGTRLWSQHFGSPTSVLFATAVAVDGAGNALVTGRANGTLNFGGGAVSTTDDAFVLKLDAATGDHSWAITTVGPGADFTTGIATDPLGRIVVVGYTFDTAVDFGAGPLAGPGGNTDAFLVSYSNADGQYRWSRFIGSPGGDTGRALALDDIGRVSVAGSVEGSVDYGGGVVTGFGGNDVFVAHYGP